MKNFSSFLIVESILDPERPSLSTNIFQLDDSSGPKLKKEVRTQILAGLSKLSQHADVLDYTLIGSILTRKYTDTTDLDINILINNKSTPMSELVKIVENLSKSTVRGTKHPIQYHVLNSKDDFINANNSADGVFDLDKNEFIRKPKEMPFYIEKYMTKFKQKVAQIKDLKDDLEDDLMDYSELKKFTGEDAESLKTQIEKELKEIEKDAGGLVDLYKKIVKDRADGFKRPLTAKEIKEYGAKNLLPGNVVYKLLERHYYLQFLEKVKNVMKDGKVTPKEVDQLHDLVKTSPH